MCAGEETRPWPGCPATVHDLKDHQLAIQQALMTKGLAGLDETSEELVEAFSITGTPDEAREKLADWEDAIDDLALHTPYIPPLDADESEDAYRQIVDAFGEVAVARREAREGSAAPA